MTIVLSLHFYTENCCYKTWACSTMQFLLSNDVMREKKRDHDDKLARVDSHGHLNRTHKGHITRSSPFNIITLHQARCNEQPYNYSVYIDEYPNFTIKGQGMQRIGVISFVMWNSSRSHQVAMHHLSLLCWLQSYKRYFKCIILI